MGKPDSTFNRRRKAKVQAPGVTEQLSSSVAPVSNAVDNLLCNNLQDSNINSVSAASSKQTCELSPRVPAANGTCNTDCGLPESDRKRSNLSISRDNGLVDADSALSEEQGSRSDLCPSSYLPAELCGLYRSEIAPLCTAHSLELSACHIHQGDDMILIIFISNSSDSQVLQIRLDLKSEQLKVM